MAALIFLSFCLQAKFFSTNRSDKRANIPLVGVAVRLWKHVFCTLTCICNISVIYYVYQQINFNFTENPWLWPNYWAYNVTWWNKPESVNCNNFGKTIRARKFKMNTFLRKCNEDKNTTWYHIYILLDS